MSNETSVIERTNELAEKEDLIHSGSQYLTFLLGKEIYGLRIDNVWEIIDQVTITPIPLVPDFIRGVINLRGNILTVIDLSYRFYHKKAEESKFTNFIILHINDEKNDSEIPIGVMIDSVKEVTFIADSNIKGTPDFGTNIRTEFISGVAKKNDEYIIILDIDKVFNIEELADFSDTIKQEG